jgi:hypothetical protein
LVLTRRGGTRKTALQEALTTCRARLFDPDASSSDEEDEEEEVLE